MGTFLVFAGTALLALLAVALLVASCEWLRQREVIDALQRNRAVFAAASPLPRRASMPASPPAAVAPPGVAVSAGVTPGRRDGPWTETRPMVLACQAITTS